MRSEGGIPDPPPLTHQLGKLDPSTFKGFDGDLIGWLLFALALAVVIGGFMIGFVEMFGELKDASESKEAHHAASWLLTKVSEDARSDGLATGPTTRQLSHLTIDHHHYNHVSWAATRRPTTTRRRP